MATYKDIQDEVRKRHGFYAKSCWIADVKEQLGHRVRRAPNRINSNNRKNPCPADKLSKIQSVMKSLGY